MKYILPLFFVMACQQANRDISKLQWLKGRWNIEDSSYAGKGIVVFEEWQSEGDSVLNGQALSIENGDTQLLERMMIAYRGKDLYYIAGAENQNQGRAIAFKLNYASDDSFCFSNPEHDFPKFIQYFRNSDKSIGACISSKLQRKYELDKAAVRDREDIGIFELIKVN